MLPVCLSCADYYVEREDIERRRELCLLSSFTRRSISVAFVLPLAAYTEGYHARGPSFEREPGQRLPPALPSSFTALSFARLPSESSLRVTVSCTVSSAASLCDGRGGTGARFNDHDHARTVLLQVG